MSRELRIPIILWICAAVCVHFMLGGGGFVVGAIHDDTSELRSLAIEARERTAQEERTFEVALLDNGPAVPEAEPPKPEDKKAATPPPAKEEKPTAEEKKKAEEKRREDEKKLAEKRKEEEKKKLSLLAKPEEKKPEPPKPLPQVDHRLAVKQHAEDNQKDNPNAAFLGEKANHVDKEEVATQTSHDRDDKNPTPGATHRGEDPAPGDSDHKTRIADSDEHKGEKNVAPGERGKDSHVDDLPLIPKETAHAPTAASPTPAPAQAGDARDKATAQAMAPAAPPAPGGPAAPASPDVQSTPSGGWSFNPAQANAGGSASNNAGAGRKQPTAGGRLWSLPGLGRQSEGGAINTNLTQQAVASLVGSDELFRLREADGERRKSEHRGSFQASTFEHWRSAIENYVSTVKPGNQTALNTARSPFANYLVSMHNRIHPIFAEGFLDSLGRLPTSSPLADQTLMTRLEIVLSTDGHLKKMGVVHTSGVTAFDIGALDSVQRASPFGPPPEAIVSTDGNVYLHWEFHRNEMACSTLNAAPFLLNLPPGGPPSSPSKGPAGPVHEEHGLPPPGANESRQGALSPPVLSVKGEPSPA